MQQIVKNNTMSKSGTIKESYTDSVLFEVRLTSRHIGISGNKAFEKLNLNLSFESYIILDIISCNDGICHSDLAKLLLRDRANTGKIVSSLEEKGYLKIKADIKNNRAVKKIFITPSGKRFCDETYPKLKPYIDIFNKNFTEEEKNIITRYMKKFRKLLGDISENQI